MNERPLRGTRMNLARVALTRIRRVAFAEDAKVSPAQRIAWGVFQQAIMDLVYARQRGPYRTEGFLSALIYLSAPTIHELSALGVETEWAIGQLRTAGVFA